MNSKSLLHVPTYPLACYGRNHSGSQRASATTIGQGFSLQSVKAAAWVAGKFDEPSRRRDDVTFSLTAGGFRYTTNFIWKKDRIGMGHYSRLQYEHLYVATRGDLPVPPEAQRSASVFDAPRGAHS